MIYNSDPSDYDHFFRYKDLTPFRLRLMIRDVNKHIATIDRLMIIGLKIDAPFGNYKIYGDKVKDLFNLDGWVEILKKLSLELSKHNNYPEVILVK